MLTAVTKASVASLGERETVAPATADLVTEGSKFEIPVGVSYKRKKTHVDITPDNVFGQVPSLREHGYMHDKRGDYTCTHCQNDFKDKNKTTRHIEQIHAKERFYCNNCAESSTGRDRSKAHLARNEESRGLMCDGCAEECESKDKLTKHEQEMQRALHKEEVVESEALKVEDRTVQTGEEKKPLICNICGKMFTSNQALERHRQIHMNPGDTYDCHTCREGVGQVLSLTEHMYMHDKGGNLTCPKRRKALTVN